MFWACFFALLRACVREPQTEPPGGLITYSVGRGGSHEAEVEARGEANWDVNNNEHSWMK